MFRCERSRAAVLLTALLALLPLLAHAAGRDGSDAPVREVPWHFTASFAAGYNGWMSYPLPQDIGYDPTLFTDAAGAGAQPHAVALVRQVVSHGEARLALGVIRPLPFRAGVAARLHLAYRLDLRAPLTHWSLILAGRNGRRYSVPLPATPGLHTVDISGAQLGLPAAGTDMQAVVLEGWLDHPANGSSSRMELLQFDLHAERPAAVKILSPVLAGAPDSRRPDGQRWVSATVVHAGAEGDGMLHMTVAPSREPLRVAVSLPDGRPGPAQNLPASPHRPVQISLSLGAKAVPGLWTAEVSSGTAHTRFAFLVLDRIAVHPRLLLSPARLAQLEHGADYGAFRAEVHRQAQAHAARIAFNPEAGRNIAMMPRGEGIGPSYPSELVPYFALMDGYADAIADNALDYRLNHDAKALATARRALLTVAQWQTWTPPRFSHHGMHTYYEVGLFAQRVAFGYDMIASQLTPAERAAIAEAMWSKAIEPTADEYFLHNRMPLAASNWMANSLGGALAATVSTLGDDPALQAREEAALAQLTAAYQQNLAGLFSGDGSEMEPAGYENFAMKGIAWGMSALQAVGIRPAGTQAMLDAFWWLDYAMVRPSLVLDTGDFDGELKAIPGFAWGAEYSGIPALRAFYDRVTKPLALPPALQLQDTGRRLEDMPGLLNLICCTHAAAPVHAPPLSRIFVKRGSAVLRSGWDKSSTVISLRAGPWFNHEHHDQGSFQVAARGDSLIADAGYADYYRDPNYPTYFTQANGHNTVLLDHDAFSQAETQGHFWAALSAAPHFTAHVLSPQLNYLAADLAPAYAGRLSGRDGRRILPGRKETAGEEAAKFRRAARHRQAMLGDFPPSHRRRGQRPTGRGPHELRSWGGGARGEAPSKSGIAAYQRQYLFLAPGVLLVRDVLQAPSAHTFTWQLHTAPGLTPALAGNRFELHAAHAWATVTAHDASPTWTDHTTPIAINAFRDLDHNVIAKRYVVTLTRPKADAASFLVALQFGGKNAAPKLQPITTRNSTGFAAANGAWTAVFRTAPGALAAGPWNTDGSVLARRGSGWLAADATWLREGAIDRVTATHAVDLAIAQTAAGLRLDVHTQTTVDLQVQTASRPSQVEVDGRPAAFSVQNGRVVLKNIPQGDHRVWIPGSQLP